MTSKPMTIDQSNSERQFEGKFSINRLDFNLGKKFPAFVVGENIDMEIKCKIQN